MLALFASLVVFAAGETAAPPPVPLIPDPEVPRYLNTAERAEWGRAVRQVELGQARVQQGTSIMNAPRLESKGAFAETAEQVAEGRRQRGEARALEAELRAQRLERLGSIGREAEEGEPAEAVARAPARDHALVVDPREAARAGSAVCVRGRSRSLLRLQGMCHCVSHLERTRPTGNMARCRTLDWRHVE